MQLVESKYWWTLPLIGLLILTGCRTYGGGTDDQVGASLYTVAQQVIAEASMIEAESGMLTEAASAHSELIPYSERMQNIVTEYTGMVEKQKKLVDQAMSVRDNFVTDWVGKDRYRALHRALGSIISERELKHNQIEQVAQDLETRLGIKEPRKPVEEGRLQIRPHHYNRSWTVTDLQDLLANIESEPAE